MLLSAGAPLAAVGRPTPIATVVGVINVSVTKVDPGKVERLRAWLSEAQIRSDEVRATFVDEGVRHERALLVDTSDGPLMIYAVECEDYNAAVTAFGRSTHPIDIEHKAIMPEILGKPVSTDTLLDIRA